MKLILFVLASYTTALYPPITTFPATSSANVALTTTAPIVQFWSSPSGLDSTSQASIFTASSVSNFQIGNWDDAHYHSTLLNHSPSILTVKDQNIVSTSVVISSEPPPPSDSDVRLLRDAMSTFYNGDYQKSESLLDRALEVWTTTSTPPEKDGSSSLIRRPVDEVAALYRVRADCRLALSDARGAIEDYGETVRLLRGPGGSNADPNELPAALLGRARASRGLRIAQSLDSVALEDGTKVESIAVGVSTNIGVDSDISSVEMNTEKTRENNSKIKDNDKIRRRSMSNSKGKGSNVRVTSLSFDNSRAISDYREALLLLSRDDDQDEESLDSTTKTSDKTTTSNPYAAWELGSELRAAGDYNDAFGAHMLAARSFKYVGDSARSIISEIDAGIDRAAEVTSAVSSSSRSVPRTTSAIMTTATPPIPSVSVESVKSSLGIAIERTTGVEGRDVDLLGRVIGKEGEGRIALAGVLWGSVDVEDRANAEDQLARACVRLEGIFSSPAASLSSSSKKDVGTFLSPSERSKLKIGIDDTMGAIEMSGCGRFKNEKFLEQSLQWPELLRVRVMKLERLEQ